jgi:hypothetical protein
MGQTAAETVLLDFITITKQMPDYLALVGLGLIVIMLPVPPEEVQVVPVDTLVLTRAALLRQVGL